MKCLLLLILSSVIYSQSDWIKWEKTESHYRIKNHIETIYKNSKADLLTYAKKIYNFLISDLDGENCSFYPSCSEFFIEAVNSSNFLKGTLMFADRFIRDLNFFKVTSNYPIHTNGKFYDPAFNYLLVEQHIKIFSLNFPVK